MTGTREELETLVDKPEIQAFLRTIRMMEGTEDQPENGMWTVVSPKDSSGLHQQTDPGINEHPWEVYSGAADSMFWKRGGKYMTAAGPYQITYPTYKDLKKAGYFEDGSWNDPREQDLAALALIASRGGLKAMEQGDVAAMSRAAARRWESVVNLNTGKGAIGSAHRSAAEFQAAFEDSLSRMQEVQSMGKGFTNRNPGAGPGFSLEEFQSRLDKNLGPAEARVNAQIEKLQSLIDSQHAPEVSGPGSLNYQPSVLTRLGLGLMGQGADVQKGYATAAKTNMDNSLATEKLRAEGESQAAYRATLLQQAMADVTRVRAQIDEAKASATASFMRERNDQGSRERIAGMRGDGEKFEPNQLASFQKSAEGDLINQTVNHWLGGRNLVMDTNDTGQKVAKDGGPIGITTDQKDLAESYKQMKITIEGAAMNDATKHQVLQRLDQAYQHAVELIQKDGVSTLQEYYDATPNGVGTPIPHKNPVDKLTDEGAALMQTITSYLVGDRGPFKYLKADTYNQTSGATPDSTRSRKAPTFIPGGVETP